MMQSQTPLDPRAGASSSLDASDQPLHPKDLVLSSPSIVSYVEISAPGIQPSHSVQAEKEAAHTTEKETVHAPAEKEFVPNTDGDKEVYAYPHDAKELPAGRDESPSPNQKSRICGLSRTWWFVLAAFIACMIALAIALGVVFGRRRSRAGPNPTDTVGGALNPLYYSTQGAFNGSGIALASANFGESATVLIYYQDYTGDIKVSVLNTDGSLSTASNTVTSDALNGTPISTVALLTYDTAINATVAAWHVFYLDRNGYVRELVNTNESSLEFNFWDSGPLNELNLKANDADTVGLQACYWGNFFGDTDFTFTSTLATGHVRDGLAGIHLWYADTDTSIQQYSWYQGANQWSNDNHTWGNVNGHAGIGCQTWDSGTTQYVFMADLDNNLSIFWKDSNSSNESPNHPINIWVNTSISIPNVHPSSSIGYTEYLVLQAADNTIRGYNISWAAENTSIAPAYDGSAGYDEWVIHFLNGSDVNALSETHLACIALRLPDGRAEEAIYFQIKGDDMILWTRDLVSSNGPWTSLSLPVS